jgi:UDP-glucose 4-epimerase
LAQAGVSVTVVDASIDGCGANIHNIAPGGDSIRLIQADIADARDFSAEIGRASVIFNLAGDVSHLESMRDPIRDCQLNVAAQLQFLEECARAAPGVRVVYASTRQIYGAPRYAPVDEGHPIQPLDFNGIHKYAATAYHLIASKAGKIDGRALCLTNVYGPRMALNLPRQGFLGGFLRKALLGQTIEIFGDGRQLRDPVHVDDAVDAFLLAGAVHNPPSRLWNVGGGEAMPLSQIGRIISEAAGAPEPVFKAFPPELRTIDIGSYCSDCSKIQAELGWRPRIDFRRGVRATVEFFRQELAHYIDAPEYGSATSSACSGATQSTALAV